RNAVEHGSIRIELLPQLIEVRELEIRAQANRSRVGWQFTEEQPEERRLTRAVRANEANAIAAHDRRRETASDGTIAVREADVACVDHQLPRSFGFLGLQTYGAYALASRLAFDAQCFERANTAFVARPTRLDSSANPHLFLRELLVELRPLLRL